MATTLTRQQRRSAVRTAWTTAGVVCVVGCSRAPEHVVPQGSASNAPTATVAPSEAPDAGPDPSIATKPILEKPVEHFATRIATGGATNCALTGDGEVYCWGANASGQLGDGLAIDQPHPTRLSVPRALEVGVGTFFGCARLADDKVACWGSRSRGAIGDGSLEGSTRPTVLPGLDGVQELDCGDTAACAVRRDGSVWCWGQLPFEEKIAYVPVDVTALKGWSHIRLGTFDVCAQSSTGQVGCWRKKKKSSSSPTGTTDTSLSLALLPGITPVRELSRHAAVQCAVLENASVSCWMGDGDARVPGYSFIAPTRMPLDDVVHVAAGWRHICAVLGNKSLVCLGGNESGALGVGGNLTIPRRTPERVELDGVVDVSAGPGHTCALTTAGAVWCWGENDHGQLGNGKIEAGLSGSVNPIPGRVPW